jgi:diguanylate cyclase (GGDEF)-like protein
MGSVQDAAASLLHARIDPTSRLLDAMLELNSAEGGVHELAPLLCELACSVAGLEGVAIELVDGPDVVCIAGVGSLAAMVDSRIPRNGSLSGLVIATGLTQRCDDTRRDTRVDRATCQRLGIRSLAILPIRRGHHSVAVLNVASVLPSGVSDSQLEHLAPFVQAASIRLVAAATAESSAAQLALLQDITEASRKVLLNENPAQCLVDSVARIAGAPHVYLVLPHDEVTLAITHCSGHSLIGLKASIDGTNSGEVFQSGRPKVVADWGTDRDSSPRLIESIAGGDRDDVRSSIYVPLLTTDGPAGVVVALMSRPLTVTDAELLGLLELLATEAGIAITRDALLRRLADQARTDALTGLSNRRAWSERLEEEIARASRTGSPVAVAMLDLDFFKQYNDSLGHPAGDALLVAVARAWSELIRPSDLLARVGGEEFAVLLPETDTAAAAAILARLGAAVPDDQTVSIGVTMWVRGQSAEAAMHRADEALYAAKSAGRNQVITR